MTKRRNWPNQIMALPFVVLLSMTSAAVVAQEEPGETPVTPEAQEDTPEVQETPSGATLEPAAETTPAEGASTETEAVAADPTDATATDTPEEPAAPVANVVEMVNLNLQKQPVDEIIEYIVKWTGKVVMVQEQALLSKKITVMSEDRVPKDKAIELLFQAFKLNDLAVVETDEMIMIDQITDIRSLQPGVVLGPAVDIESMPDDGNIVIKVFQVEKARAQDVFDRIEANKPDYVEMTVDANSNQIIVEGDIGYAKRISRLIAILDVEPYIAVKTETFRLKYADANTVAGLVETLFAPSGTARTSTSSRTSSQQQRGNTRGGTQSRGTTNQNVVEVGTSEQLTVTVLEPTNSITVRAEPDILSEISVLLETAWDVAPSREGEIFRIYDLLYTDPIKVKELLSALLESGSGGSAGAARGQQRTQAGAAGSGADVAVANIFRIEAYPDSNRLIVISKSPSNFEWLDQMIERIDQPLSVGMPVNIELKHASAIEVAEILNALLASAGANSSISAPEEGLTGVDFSVAGSDGSSNNNSGGNSQDITFPWQSNRGAGDESAEVSAIVGKARLVPNSAQNSLLVLATPEIQAAVLEIIEELDRPGRQVMITAVLAEVELGDEFEFGLRFGQIGNPTNGDNAIVINGQNNDGSMFDASRGNIFPSSWTTSILSFGVDATVVLQALDQLTNTRILQQPRIFTSDNKEAKFFDGKDVPFQASGESSTAGGSVIANYEQVPVGIGVNVRPRITREKNVAMEIEILLSNVDSTGAGNPGGNPTIKRRQTNTTVTVKNGQTIVLSGIRTESEAMVKRKVPILGDIPVLDLLFSSESENTVVSELVVFITPIVVDNPDDNDVNFNELDRQRLEQLSDPMSQRTRELQKQLGVEGVGSPANGDPRRD